MPAVPWTVGTSTAVLSEDGYVLFSPWIGKKSSVDSTANSAESLGRWGKIAWRGFQRQFKGMLLSRAREGEMEDPPIVSAHPAVLPAAPCPAPANILLALPDLPSPC